jgi:UPF0716 protein FxsA
VLGRLFLLFTLVPIVELYLLIQVGEVIGGLATVGIVLATGAAGAWLARREGRRAMEEIQASIQRGELPDDALLAGLLVLVGGVFLITPGVITDFVGLSLLIPPMRRIVARSVRKRLGARMQLVGGPGIGMGIGMDPGMRSPFGEGLFTDGSDGEVIDVEAEVRPGSDDVGDAPR